MGPTGAKIEFLHRLFIICYGLLGRETFSDLTVLKTVKTVVGGYKPLGCIWSFIMKNDEK
jgi:hypothetical protein